MRRPRWLVGFHLRNVAVRALRIMRSPCRAISLQRRGHRRDVLYVIYADEELLSQLALATYVKLESTLDSTSVEISPRINRELAIKTTGSYVWSYDF